MRANVGCLLLPRLQAEVEAQETGLEGEAIAVYHRGRLISLSVEAEDAGLKVGRRLTQARAICFAAEYIPFIEERYQPHWNRVLDICKDHVAVIEPVEQGEVFVDLSGPNDPAKGLAYLHRAIVENTGFECRSACAPSKLVAKIAAQTQPGQAVGRDDVEGFLQSFPLSRLWMLDKNTQKHLEALGLTTIGLLQRFTRNRLAEHFGRQAEALYNLARGIDNAPVEALYPPRTVTVHLSLPGGVDNPEAIDTALRRLSGRIANQLQLRQDVCGRIGIRVSTEEAQEASQSLRLRTPTGEEGDLLRACRTLISRFDLPDPIAAITVKATDVRRARGRQLSLFSTPADPRGRERTRKALDSVRQQFGKQAAVLGGEIEIPRRERLLALVSPS